MLPASVRIFVCTTPRDMRRAFDRLAQAAKEIVGEDARSGALFVFWLFVGSDEAGDVNAAFVSLLASCQLHRLEPGAYLRDLLTLPPRWAASRLLELAPVSWRQTLEQDDAQQRLSADPFRRASLDLHPAIK